MAILLITHDLGVVAESCDEVAVMYAGRIVERALVEPLFTHPRHPYTAGLMASIPKLSTAPGPPADHRRHRPAAWCQTQRLHLRRALPAPARALCHRPAPPRG